MKTLTSGLTTQAAAEQSGWIELYDIYLKASITTPFGTTNTIRICNYSADFSFFTPKQSPEPVGTQGNAATYKAWPIIREVIRAATHDANDKLQIGASNVTKEWAQMLADVDWYDTPVLVRKVSTTIASPTADDYTTLFSGLVDSVVISLEQVQLACSNDMGALEVIAPRENMHTNCRFKWADDQCTAIRFRAENYKTGTVGNSSTTKLVKSSDFTEDASSSASYGTDLVNPLADGAFSASSEFAGYTNQAVSVVDTANDAIGLTAHKLVTGDEITFGGTAVPAPLVAGTPYYVLYNSPDVFHVSATPGGSKIDLTTTGTAVTISTTESWAAKKVRSSNTGYWRFSTAGDWGTLTEGYWQIPDAQAGLANAALKPYLTIDFGSAKTPRVWRISSVANAKLEELVRLIVLFSSTDNATWKHETYFEIPPLGGVLYDLLHPKASTARYWRICIRSRWAESLFFSLLNKVYAYENSRHWWAHGRITFAANTSTVALRNVSRRVLESYNGEVVVADLPVAPANGDTFVIERGCPRSFNACCTRLNWENFGGELDLPNQSVIR